jgi:hypothetical protein
MEIYFSSGPAYTYLYTLNALYLVKFPIYLTYLKIWEGLEQGLRRSEFYFFQFE